MPSGARKRKAAKKKIKNGDTHHNNNNNSSSSNNSSSTHSQASEDRRSFDDRESDSGEIEREEESRGEGEALDYEEGGVSNGKGFSEEINETLQKDGSGIVDVEEETPIVILSSLDKEVAVIEEEKPVVAELEESKAVDVNSVLESHEIPKQDSIDVEGASVELVKDIFSLSQEINVGLGSSVTSDLIDSEKIKYDDLALPTSDEIEKFSSISQDLESEKVESKIVSMDEGKSSVDPNSSSGLDTVKTSEIGDAPPVTKTQVVECVTNKETLQKSDKQAVTTSEVDNVKEISTQKRSVDQTSNGINSLPIQRTSVLGCCGLFELFSGANKGHELKDLVVKIK
ncbi:hypothetical protein V2J09_010088 [Rumex salicifolius]